MTNYKKRLQIPIEGNCDTIFTTKNGTVVAIGYERIVLGGRGPYIEFNRGQLLANNLHIPKTEEKRINNGIYYYVELRSNDDSNVKVYHQKKEVSYADYKVGLFYISPFDLLADGKIIIEKLVK